MSLPSRFVICIFLAGLFLGSCTSPESESVAEKKTPNIIFIFTDDHGSQAISAYGSGLNQTPNIDRLAEEGMLFRNCFVTNSICAPSRAVILTGKHSHLNGVPTNMETFDTAQVSFPKLLQQENYETALIGKWHLKAEPSGFNFWKIVPGQGKYYNPDFITKEGTEQIPGYVTDITTDIALDWLKNGRNPDKPFMLMFQHKAPHREWSPSPKHLTDFDGEDIPEPDNLFDDYSGRGTAATMQEMEIDRHMDMWYDLKVRDYPGQDTSSVLSEIAQALRDRMTPDQLEYWDAAYGPENRKLIRDKLKGKDLIRWKYQRYIKDYLRTVASVDDNIGRLLDFLDKEGLSENTVVVYSSDQGFFLGEHGWFDKRWMYEESFRTPLIVRWPGVVKAGSENTDLVQNLDFAETLLDIAGVEVPEAMQGKSLLPLLKGETPENWRKSVYYRYFEYPAEHMVNQHYGIRTKDYKLIYFNQLDEWEFYDLNKDPKEMQSQYNNVDYQDVINSLKTQLDSLKKMYGDTHYEYTMKNI